MLRHLLWSLLCLYQVSFAAKLPDLSALQEDSSEPVYLSAEQAFKPQVTKTATGWHVTFNIADGYYLYKNRINLLDTENSGEISFVQPPLKKHDKNFGEVEIYHQQLDVDIHGINTENPRLRYQGCSEQQLCYPPQTLQLNSALPDTPLSADNGSSTDHFSGKSLWWIVLSFLGLGIGLSLTPCVFPMIPILSSIIAGQTVKRSGGLQGFLLALAYVIGMACAYAMIGILVSAFGARVNLSAYTQTPLVISLAALLFIVLALPMFGLFELQLPAFIRNRLNDAGNKQQGGFLLGTFLMGFFAALVVSPCVSAPLAGALLYLSSTGDVLTGGSALFALGMGMGMPLLIIGLTGGKFLPKAGSWMLNIKAAFGIGLLAVAIGLLNRIIPAQATLLLSALLALGVSVFGGLFTANSSLSKRYINLLFFCVGLLWLIGAAMGNTELLRPLHTNTVGDTSSNLVGNPIISINSVAQLHNTLATANAQQQQVIVDFYADWCTSCQEMDKFLHAANIQQMLQHYRLLRFDISAGTPEQLTLLAELNIFGPPALQLFNLQGKPQGPALQGLPDEEILHSWLNKSE
jgi:thioredoxin:protein disulfide reductase